ncbi:unnamed protein product [Caenorhabditis bovis]|uniref:O-phosphoseryl-tRNA(Sec) selenium transferase n=1 Tax=Caenorhabditis bovis TaxID=2654633 RepID=A0A8S1E2B4_9PELO|nr:unnamed protein product [Caenorhabditis bovis]
MSLPGHTECACLPLCVDCQSRVEECVSSRSQNIENMKSSFGKKEGEYSRLVSKSSNKLLNNLWEKKKIPEDGWSEHALDLFLSWLSSHDTNNRVDMMPVGAGEREGRVLNPMVQRLHSNLAHGIGRSGNLLEIQPKALGSSMLACFANEFAMHSLQLLGLTTIRGCIVVPLCTGMSLSLCMSAWRKNRPNAKYVVFHRIDQKSSLKSIYHAGFEPIVIEPIREGDGLITDVETLNHVLEEKGEEILCVMSTTSCFAPRSPDNVEAIAAICSSHNIYHLINNAYGLQSEEVLRRISAASEAGRIDAVVQSLDKNYQVPVGGAVIVTFKFGHVQQIAQTYPGRASSVPARDLVLTLLYQGQNGFRQQFEKQKQMFLKMKRKLVSFAEKIGECVYEVPDNEISLAITLSTIPPDKQTLFGSVLFSRGITGSRVVTSTTKVTKIENTELVNFGSHCSEQHGGYLNIACAIGMTDVEMEELFCRLTSTYNKFHRQITRISDDRSARRFIEEFDMKND